MASNPTPAALKVTPGEYLANERQASFKSEYLNGRVVAMAGASHAHALLVARLLRLIDQHLDGKPCSVSASDLRIWVPEANTYAYPDLSVVCEPVQYQDSLQDVVLNPLLIVEVLSPSTEKLDRQQKFAAYRSISSFQQYVLVSQTEAWVEVYTRSQEGFWIYAGFGGLDANVELTSIGLTVPVRDIYARLDFINSTPAAD
jgi:Uma2 family endonuclease